MDHKCGACGSASTATQFNTRCCLDCGAVTDNDGKVRSGRGNAETVPDVAGRDVSGKVDDAEEKEEA